jgi:RimJ/RimL family protein N-acetyltransferase
MKEFIVKKTCQKIQINSDLALRPVDGGDLEHLRLWKNSVREFFFHKDIIEVEQQRLWYEAYLQRSLDLMLILEISELAAGCMGIRWLNGHWDIYNVIMGNNAFKGHGFMSLAFREMLRLAEATRTGVFQLEVLIENPAVDWYKRQGFIITSNQESFYVMQRPAEGRKE